MKTSLEKEVYENLEIIKHHALGIILAEKRPSCRLSIVNLPTSVTTQNGQTDTHTANSAFIDHVVQYYDQQYPLVLYPEDVIYFWSGLLFVQNFRLGGWDIYSQHSTDHLQELLKPQGISISPVCGEHPDKLIAILHFLDKHYRNN